MSIMMSIMVRYLWLFTSFLNGASVSDPPCFSGDSPFEVQARTHVYSLGSFFRHYFLSALPLHIYQHHLLCINKHSNNLFQLLVAAVIGREFHLFTSSSLWSSVKSFFFLCVHVFMSCLMTLSPHLLPLEQTTLPQWDVSRGHAAESQRLRRSGHRNCFEVVLLLQSDGVALSSLRLPHCVSGGGGERLDKGNPHFVGTG